MAEIDLHRLGLLCFFLLLFLAGLILTAFIWFLGSVHLVLVGVLVTGVLLILARCFEALLVFTLRRNRRRRVLRQHQRIHAARHVEGVAGHVEPACRGAVIR